MKITFQMLCDRLESINIVYCSSTADFTYAQLLSRQQSSYLPDTLYICQAEQLRDFNHAFPSKLLCVGLLDDATAKQIVQSSYMLQITSESTLEEIYQMVLTVIKQYHAWSERLLAAIIEGNDFSVYLNILHEILKNPMLIIDDNNCLVAYTKNDQYDNDIWSTIVSTGFVSYMNASEQRIGELQESFWAGSAPSLITPSEVRDPMLVSKVMTEQKAAAILIVCAMHHPISNGQIDICTYFCKIISLEFRKNMVTKISNASTSRQFLRDLLNKCFSSPVQLESRIKHISWSPKKYYSIMVIPCGQFLPDSITPEKITEQLRMIVPDSICIVYKENIVSLLSYDRKESFLSYYIKRICSFLSEYELQAGISDDFEDLMDLPLEYHHAMQTLNTAALYAENERLHQYTEYSFLNICNILISQQPIESFCHKGLFRLIDYDKKSIQIMPAHFFCILKII